MIDIREHGGSFGGGKYKKGSDIPVWMLNPVAPHVASQVFSAWGVNGYRPPLDYSESNGMFYVGAGRIMSITKDFVNSSTLNLSERTFSEILVFKGKVFAISGYVYQSPLDLTSYSSSSQSSMNGLVPLGEFLYSFSNSDKKVYKFDPAQSTLTVASTTALINASVNHYFFQRDETNFFFGTQEGNLVKYDLNGNLLKTLNLHTSQFNSMSLINDHIYVIVGNTLHKVNKDTLTKVWTVTLPATSGYGSSIQGDKNYLYITHSGKGFFIIEMKDGSLSYDPSLVVTYSGGSSSSMSYGSLRGNYVFISTWIRSSSYSYDFNLVKMPVKQTLLEG